MKGIFSYIEHSFKASALLLLPLLMLQFYSIDSKAWASQHWTFALNGNHGDWNAGCGNHYGWDGTFCRYDGQAWITTDDNLYIAHRASPNLKVMHLLVRGNVWDNRITMWGSIAVHRGSFSVMDGNISTHRDMHARGNIRADTYIKANHRMHAISFGLENDTSNWGWCNHGDGSFCRYKGQAYISVDDNLYIGDKDNPGYHSIHMIVHPNADDRRMFLNTRMLTYQPVVIGKNNGGINEKARLIIKNPHDNFSCANNNSNNASFSYSGLCVTGVWVWNDSNNASNDKYNRTPFKHATAVFQSPPDNAARNDANVQIRVHDYREANGFHGNLNSSYCTYDRWSRENFCVGNAYLTIGATNRGYYSMGYHTYYKEFRINKGDLQDSHLDHGDNLLRITDSKDFFFSGTSFQFNNQGAQDTKLVLEVTNSSGGDLSSSSRTASDPYIGFELKGLEKWYMGVDQSRNGIFSISKTNNLENPVFALDHIRSAVVIGRDQAINAPNIKLHVEGGIYLAGEFKFRSDRNAKTNINNLNYGLAHVNKLQPKTYYFKDDRKQEQLKMGFIAQDVEKILPELVSKDNNNENYSLDYVSLIPVLTKAIQELKLEQEKNKAEIERLKKLLNK